MYSQVDDKTRHLQLSILYVDRTKPDVRHEIALWGVGGIHVSKLSERVTGSLAVNEENAHDDAPLNETKKLQAITVQ